MVMPDWGWLSRGALLGLLGTAALTAAFSLEGTQQQSGGTAKPQGVHSLDGSASQTLRSRPPQRQKVPVPASLVRYPARTNNPPPRQPQNSMPRLTSPTQGTAEAAPVKPLIPHADLFATPVSLGMLAIGTAEGNYRVFREKGTLYVEQTPLYFGHTDPGNLSWGERVTNFGPCSDQGRSGGNIALAEQKCLERARKRLQVNLADLSAAGIDPNRDLEALLNTADLYNQAKAIHSRVFPYALAIAQRGGKQGVEAIAWARTASFYLNKRDEFDLENGENRATGLLGICARENRPVTEWECVYHDQLRRTKAISGVLEKYFQVSNASVLRQSVPNAPAPSAPAASYTVPAQGRIVKTYSVKGKKSHRGIDIAAPAGTKIIAAADGKAIAVGRGGDRQVVRAIGEGWGDALLVVLEHANGDRTIYAHNQRNLIAKGQTVKQGQEIALVGNTGDATRPHVHFELHRNGKPTDPLKYLKLN